VAIGDNVGDLIRIKIIQLMNGKRLSEPFAHGVAYPAYL